MKRFFTLIAVAGLLFVGCNGDSNDNTFKATHLTGLYNGYFMGYYDTPNYYFYMGNAAVEELEAINPKYAPNATYYVVDLFGSESTEKPIQLPDGRYTFGNNSAEGTFSEFSRVVTTDSRGAILSEINLAEGTLVVDGESVTLTATDINGNSHSVRYEGFYSLVDASNSTAADDVVYEATNLYIRYIEDNNFYITFGPNDFLSDGLTNAPSESYYFFSVYADIDSAPENIHAYNNLPKGIYTHDTTDSCQPWTIDITDRAMYVKNNANGYTIDADYFSNATILVTDEDITAVVTTQTSKKQHRITYSFE